MIDDRQLISKLLATDFIGQEALQQGLELAQRDDAPLYHVLIAYELIDERDLVNTASEILNVDSVDLQADDVEPDTAHLISAELAVSNRSVPVEIIDDDGLKTLKLAMTDPIDVMAMDEIASHVGIDIQPVLVGPNQLAAAIRELYKSELEPEDPQESSPSQPSDPVLEDGEVEEVEEILDFDDFAMEIEEEEDGGGPVDDDDEPLDLYGDDDIQLSEEFIIDDGEVADIEDDEPFELSEEILLDDHEEEKQPELVDAPDGLVADEDSWAAMFGDDSDEEPASDSEQPSSSGPSKSAADSTQIGNPANMGLEEMLKDASDDDREDPSTQDASSDDEKDAPADDDRKNTGTARYRDPEAHGSTPVGMGLRHDSETKDQDHRDKPESDDKPAKKPKKKLVPKSIREALKNASKRRKNKAKSTKSPDLPEPPSPPNTGPDEEPPKAQEATPDEEVDAGDQQPTDETKSSTKKAAKDNAEVPSPPSGAFRTDPDQSSGAQNTSTASDDDGKAALGRIDVKTVAVPTFKGAVEKRSDKEREQKRKRQQTPKKNESAIRPASETREISLTEMADLVEDSDNDEVGEFATLEFPSSLNTNELLRALIRLLMAKDIITSEDLETLIHDLS